MPSIIVLVLYIFEVMLMSARLALVRFTTKLLLLMVIKIKMIMTKVVMTMIVMEC